MVCPGFAKSSSDCSAMPALNRRVVASAAAVIAAVALSACTQPDDTATPTAIVSETHSSERVEGVVPVSENALLWVTAADDVLIQASDIEETHPFTLAGRSVILHGKDNDLAPAVSEDGAVVALPVRASDGSGGVALVRDDGYNMTLHLYGGPGAVLGSVKFMPEFGLTLLSIRDDESRSRVIAINNYGIRQFDLPVTDFTGAMRYSPDELQYMVIDRRPLEQEVELVPFAEPGESTVLNGDSDSEQEKALYASAVVAISGWR